MNKELFEKIKKIITVNCDITDYYEDDDGDETDEPCRYALGAESLKDSVIKICNVIEQAKKDTAREILQLIIKRHGYFCNQYYSPILIELNRKELDQIAKEYGIDLEKE